jgi:hypothetical protein
MERKSENIKGQKKKTKKIAVPPREYIMADLFCEKKEKMKSGKKSLIKSKLIN